MPISTSNKNLISATLANHMLRCLEEYEAIKNSNSTKFKTVLEFCKHYGFSRQNFLKIYNRYKAYPELFSLVPQKRGPKYSHRRISLDVENRIIDLRKLGNNRYEIVRILAESAITVCATTVYNICRKHGLNRLTTPIKQHRSKIIMHQAGELVHIDLYQLPKGITIADARKPLYILGVIDDYTRLVWLELLSTKQALDVMFAALKSFNMLRGAYGIEIESLMSDNGAEFGSGAAIKNQDTHPFERLLCEMNIKHIYTKPYQPQANGKIERFWKTLHEDFVDGSLFENVVDLANELLAYNVYYNEHRPHTAINGMTPIEKSKTIN